MAEASTISQREEEAMKWLLRPVFHKDGTITFKKYGQAPKDSVQVLTVHESVTDFRTFWEPMNA